MNASNNLANKAMQAAQSAVERLDSAQLPGAAASSQAARPPTAAGPIPMPASGADASALSQRVQQLESQLTSLTSAWDRLEGQKAKEEFAKQLLAAKGDGLLTPGGSGGSGSGHHQHHHQHSNSNGAAAAAPSGAPAQPAARRPSNNGAGASGSAPPPPPGEVIDGSGLLPANNNFPSRFGGGAAGLRAARDRTPGGRGGEGGEYSGAGGSGGFGGGAGGGGGGGGLALPGHAVIAGAAGAGVGAGGPPGGDLMSTHRYGTVMPSDFKLAEQRKAGPRQGFM
ncbi:hypothetical protein HXX76_004080 [Chlamydomonas incerta]|uniref:Uncharacterized protein n=1 Tax=Chlamydomonas incerta TaxID=51695 RepID=A0A835W8M3_CHLIN|nr:hypothetical protein HXX76_004080 [Chlamydomonas incerta]|eukprot:KAG2439961.1 hypothetical protein HXX76_004080 [Chlamydomonas incerta]